MIHGLLEVDVTKAREFLRDHKVKTGSVRYLERRVR
jgi:hypothetical protein